mgnify:CR=1 FL=1
MLDPAAIEALGGEDAALVLCAREGFYFANAAGGEWLAPATSKEGTATWPACRPCTRRWCWRDRGAQRRGDLGVVRMTRIAPTLARVLGVELGPQADQPLP